MSLVNPIFTNKLIKHRKRRKFMLKIIMFIGSFVILSTCLSSKCFWYNLLVRKTLIGDDKHIGIAPKKLDRFLDWQLKAVFLQIFILIISYTVSQRIHFFCGGTLVGMILVYVSQIVYSLFLNDNSIRLRKVFFIGWLLLIVYLLLFWQDNLAFSKAKSNQTQWLTENPANGLYFADLSINEFELKNKNTQSIGVLINGWDTYLVYVTYRRKTTLLFWGNYEVDQYVLKKYVFKKDGKLTFFNDWNEILKFTQN